MMFNVRTPVNDKAATLEEIRSAPKDSWWMIVGADSDGQRFIEAIGKFTSGFLAADEVEPPEVTFTVSHGRTYAAQYDTFNLGLEPMVECDRNKPVPTQADFDTFELGIVADPRDPYLGWSSHFVVNLKNAAESLGSTQERIDELVETFTERNRQSDEAGQTVPYNKDGMPMPLLYVQPE